MIVCYDSADDRRRQQIAKTLLDCGTRIEESVFECVLEPLARVTLIARLRDISGEWPEDRIHVIDLCSRCAQAIVAIGGAARASTCAVYIV
jgi:CRISPR-associated endonuclease Cas2